jgi:hypothetical protein
MAAAMFRASARVFVLALVWSCQNWIWVSAARIAVRIRAASSLAFAAFFSIYDSFKPSGVSTFFTR